MVKKTLLVLLQFSPEAGRSGDLRRMRELVAGRIIKVSHVHLKV